MAGIFYKANTLLTNFAENQEKILNRIKEVINIRTGYNFDSVFTLEPTINEKTSENKIEVKYHVPLKECGVLGAMVKNVVLLIRIVPSRGEEGIDVKVTFDYNHINGGSNGYTFLNVILDSNLRTIKTY